VSPTLSEKTHKKSTGVAPNSRCFYIEDKMKKINLPSCNNNITCKILIKKQSNVTKVLTAKIFSKKFFQNRHTLMTSIFNNTT